MMQFSKAVAASTIPLLFLSGCGGGGDDSSPSTPETTYQLQFVELVSKPIDSIDNDCTLFGLADASDDSYWYALEVPGVNVLINDADGTLSQTLTANDEGSLTISMSDIEEGGYITISDDLGGQTFSEYYLLAFEKSLIQDMVIAVTNGTESSSCYNANQSHPTEQTRYATFSLAEEFTTSPAIYSFETTEASWTEPDIFQVTIPVRDNYSALVTAYREYDQQSGKLSEMAGYALVDENNLCDDLNNCDDSFEINYLSADIGWSRSDSATLSHLYLGLVYDNWVYRWDELESTTDSYAIPDTLTYGSWFVNAGATESGWNIQRNTSLPSASSGFDLDLLQDLSLAAPQIAITGNCGVFACAGLSGADSSEFDYQFTRFNAVDSGGRTSFAYHIYTPANAQIVVPQVNSSLELETSSVENTQVRLISNANNSGISQLALNQFEQQISAGGVTHPGFIFSLNDTESFRRSLAQQDWVVIDSE